MARLNSAPLTKCLALTAGRCGARRHSGTQSDKLKAQLRDLVAQRYPDLLAGADTVLGLTQKVTAMQEMLQDVPELCAELVAYKWDSGEGNVNAVLSEQTTHGNIHNKQSQQLNKVSRRFDGLSTQSAYGLLLTS